MNYFRNFFKSSKGPSIEELKDMIDESERNDEESEPTPTLDPDTHINKVMEELTEIIPLAEEPIAVILVRQSSISDEDGGTEDVLKLNFVFNDDMIKHFRAMGVKGMNATEIMNNWLKSLGEVRTTGSEFL